MGWECSWGDREGKCGREEQCAEWVALGHWVGTGGVRDCGGSGSSSSSSEVERSDNAPEALRYGIGHR